MMGGASLLNLVAPQSLPADRESHRLASGDEKHGVAWEEGEACLQERDGVYAEPCAHPSQFRGLILLPPQPACRACLSPPCRVRDLRLRRVESFFRAANSTEPGLPDQKQERGLEGVLVLPGFCSPQPHPSLLRPPGADPGSSLWRLRPLLPCRVDARPASLPTSPRQQTGSVLGWSGCASHPPPWACSRALFSRLSLST